MAEEKKPQQIKVPILTQIQNELKAPKNQYNSFGKYKYRNAEDIESALKPLLAKYGASLYIDEDIKAIGERKFQRHVQDSKGIEDLSEEGNHFYIVETIHYKDPEQSLIVKGWAREAEQKKGMDASQVTGATSSYATKYALGKLFLIDDTKDADSQKPVQTRNSYQGQQANRYRQTKPTSSKPVQKVSERVATSKRAAEERQQDQELMTWEVNYPNANSPKAKLVKIISSAYGGDQGAQKFLHGLTGNDKVAYGEIYKRALYLGV